MNKTSPSITLPSSYQLHTLPLNSSAFGLSLTPLDPHRSRTYWFFLVFFFLKPLQHGQNLFRSPRRLQSSFMLLQNLGSKQSPPSQAALKACSPPPAQYQAAAYKNLWRLRAAISINVVFSHVIETEWMQIPIFHFFHLGSKAKYCY